MIIGSAKGGVTLPNENNSTVGFGGAPSSEYPAGQGSASDATNTNATANSATAIDGVGSLDFNGTSASVNLSQNLANSLNVTAVQAGMSDTWTVSIWVYVEDDSSPSAIENSYLSKITYGYSDPHHEFNLRQSGAAIQFGNGVLGFTNWALTHDGWTHLVFVASGIGESTQTWTVYEDAGSAHTDSTTSTPVWNVYGETPMYCGQQGNGARWMSGQIQEVCFWNKGLSSTNRTALFNGYDHSAATDEDNTGAKANTVEKDNIIAYYTFDGGSVINTAIP